MAEKISDSHGCTPLKSLRLRERANRDDADPYRLLVFRVRHHQVRARLYNTGIRKPFVLRISDASP